MIYLPSEIPQEWRDVLLLIPGYDSIATADDAWFDAEIAQLAIDFFPECLTHVEGDLYKKPFALQPWQKSLIANLTGWQRRDVSGRKVRRYREAFVYIPRKNGKTPLVAGIALLIFFTDPERGQQGFIAAAEKKQAGKLYRHCKGMIDAQPILGSQCKMYGGNAPAGQAKSISRESDNSFLQVVSADEAGAHGDNPHLVIVDELHTQPNRKLIDTFQSSFKSCNRPQPLFICISTADWDRPSICNEKLEYARKIRDGSIAMARGVSPDDPTIANNSRFLPVIYEAEQNERWDDEEVWKRVNPNMSVSVSIEALREECKLAKEIPATLPNFLRLALNMKTSTNETCISLVDWDNCHDKNIDLATLDGREVHAALDIGATSDFTALVRLFPHDDAEEIEVPIVLGEKIDVADGEPVPLSRTVIRRSYTAMFTLWLPEKRIRRNHRMDAQIDVWIKQGLIRVTGGTSVDYDLILEEIIALVEPYQLVDFAFDRGFQGGQMGTNLMKTWGDKVVMFPQGILSMAAPFREVIELLPCQRLHHDGNPAVRWQAGNVVAERKGGLMKPSKEKSTEKIDAFTALVMAVGRALFAAANSPQSCYDTRGIITL